MKRIALLSVLLVFVLQPMNGGTARQPTPDTQPFPRPDGPYHVGTADYFWIDGRRDEIFTRNGTAKRHLLVQVWYPAQVIRGARLAPYILTPGEFGQPTPRIEDLFPVKTNAMLDAPIAGTKKKFPVVLFSHGMGMTRFSSTFLMESLASHGFVTFAIGHSRFDGTLVFPDGYRPDQNVDFEAVQSGPRDDSDGDHSHFVLDAFQKDTEFVLAQIERLNETQSERFHDRLDLARLGICGWSIGGINAAQMCKKDGRLLAGINFDGMVGGDVVKGGIDKPFMVMKSGLSIPDNIASDENSFLSGSSNDIYRVTIAGAVHTSFSDLGLFNSRMAGEIDAKYCFSIVTHITVAFFDKYINMNSAVDLEKVAGQYPEVRFERFSNSP